MKDLWQRLIVSFTALLFVITVGTIGYRVLGDGNWSWLECAYMTVNVITTLGLDTLPGFGDPLSRAFTILLLTSGIGTFLYFASSLTAFILESDLRDVFWRRRMQKQIDRLANHVIICGVGLTGRHVVREMQVTRTPFVAIDEDEAHLRSLMEGEDKHDFPYIIGDATEDEVLMAAGLERARALVAALHDDKQNLYVVLTARNVNPALRIVAKSVGRRAPDKLRRAGADSVVSTTEIGGTRLAAEVLRPHVTEFLEEMLRERHMQLRIEEVDVPPDSPIAGLRLRDAHIRSRSEALVLAIRDGATGKYAYNPGPDAVLSGGSTLIVLVPVEALETLRSDVRHGFNDD